MTQKPKYILSEEEKSTLRQMVGKMIYEGLKSELKFLGEVISYPPNSEVPPEGIASFDFVAIELKAAMDRALEEDTGDLKAGANKAAEDFKDY